MFESLGQRLNGVFKRLRGHGKITETNIREAMHEVRLALLQADVNFKVVKEFVQSVTEKSLGAEVLQSISPGEHVIGLVHRELIELLGARAAAFDLKQGVTNVILLFGLQGSGKTTFAGKLALHCAKKGWKPLLVACDIHRPAAIRQLHVVGEGVGVPAFDLGTDHDPSEITERAKRHAVEQGRDLLIVDTAGRLHIDEVRMDELRKLKRTAEPTFTFLVADAMTGQDAVNSAAKFHEQVGIDGVCLTKQDGDARGGAALSIRKVTGKPIFFAGVGEKPDDLEVFHPDRVASRILGMGDVVTLFEKASETVDQEKALEMQQKIRRQTFTLQDFLDQMQQVRRMGPLKKVLEMIPGVKQMMGEEEFDEQEFKHIEAIIQSMTPAERENPSLLNGSRRKRIADGAGMTPADVNSLLQQFDQSKKLMKMMVGAPMRAMGRAAGVPAAPGGGGGGGGGYSKKKRKPRPKHHKKK
ncbi:MAG: signal recognition particle protein [Candidatus Sumerlaeota bacterium]|nr:signal recognition particle protein [Candidatus Sumerlaeota bacterium]